jgi:glycosyltransferase involved in cell wall biosynthesis
MDVRVGIDGKCLMPPRTGVGRYVAGLLSGCEELGEEGIELRVLRPRTRRRTLPWVLLNIQAASLANLSVLHLPFYYGPLVPRCPIVVVVHDLIVIEHPEWFPQLSVKPIRTLMPRSIRRADGIVTFSTPVAAAITERFKIDPRRIRVIPHGVDVEVFRPPTQEEEVGVRAKFGLENPYLLQLGALEPRRGIDLAMKATAIVRRELGRVDLVLAGDRRAAVASLLSPPPWVRLLGQVDDEALPGLLAGAAAVLAPSRGEGFDLPVLEALACGAPVVASDIPPHVEHFTGGVELFCSGDAESLAASIVHVLRDEDHARALRVAGRRVAERFRWADSARAHIALWREVAA